LEKVLLAHFTAGGGSKAIILWGQEDEVLEILKTAANNMNRHFLVFYEAEQLNNYLNTFDCSSIPLVVIWGAEEIEVLQKNIKVVNILKLL